MGLKSFMEYINENSRFMGTDEKEEVTLKENTQREHDALTKQKIEKVRELDELTNEVLMLQEQYDMLEMELRLKQSDDYLQRNNLKKHLSFKNESQLNEQLVNETVLTEGQEKSLNKYLTDFKVTTKNKLLAEGKTFEQIVQILFDDNRYLREKIIGEVNGKGRVEHLY